jgi:serine/threonine protein kinase
MEYCSRGNFYTFVQGQPEKRISEDAGRFYIAEILSGIEFLHLHVFHMHYGCCNMAAALRLHRSS